MQACREGRDEAWYVFKNDESFSTLLINAAKEPE